MGAYKHSHVKDIGLWKRYIASLYILPSLPWQLLVSPFRFLFFIYFMSLDNVYIHPTSQSLHCELKVSFGAFSAIASDMQARERYMQ